MSRGASFYFFWKFWFLGPGDELSPMLQLDLRIVWVCKIMKLSPMYSSSHFRLFYLEMLLMKKIIANVIELYLSECRTTNNAKCTSTTPRQIQRIKKESWTCASTNCYLRRRLHVNATTAFRFAWLAGTKTCWSSSNDLWRCGLVFPWKNGDSLNRPMKKLHNVYHPFIQVFLS